MPDDTNDTSSYDEWRASDSNSGEGPETLRAESPSEPETSSEESTAPSDDIDARIEAALARERARHAEETAGLRAQLPLGTTPEFAGGVELGQHAPTWSQYDQTLARNGEHPWQNDEVAPHLMREKDLEDKE